MPKNYQDYLAEKELEYLTKFIVYEKRILFMALDYVIWPGIGKK